MSKVVVVVSFIIHIAGVLTKTIIEDVNDYMRENGQNLTNITVEDFVKSLKKDPCDPYTPRVPDFSELKTLSEIKCKEYIWNKMNQERQEVCSSSRSRKRKKEQEALMDLQLIDTSRKAESDSSEDDYIVEDKIIYHGRDALIGEFGHMAAVGWRAKDPAKGWVFKCGSSLISDRFLLTAAHCTSISPRFVTDIVNSRPEVVMLGVENIADTVGTPEHSPKLENIKRIIVHPNYKSPKKYNDIALLEVDSIEYNAFIRPACIWPHDDVQEFEDSVILTGWGLKESGKPSPILQAAEVVIIGTPTCDYLLKPFKNRNWHGVMDTQMCAGKLSGGVDTCQGDSGGPLQVNIETNTKDGIYMILGVTSFGMNCGVKDRPGVYTRVSSFVPWIEEIVWGQNRKTL